jgi:ribulose-5-phosphate 4-epimerase/fuculose-1-phosphate aldolase
MRETVVSSDSRFRVLEEYQALNRRGLTIGSPGHGSIREGGTVWITPMRKLPSETEASRTCVSHIWMAHARTIARLMGAPVAPCCVWRVPAVGAVVNTHGPSATAWSYRFQDLDLRTEEFAYREITRIMSSRTIGRALRTWPSA